MKQKFSFAKQTFRQNAKIYRILANPKRLEILNRLRDRELSVQQLVRLVGARKANISQHLAVLRHARLVQERPEGREVYYQIIDPRIVEPCRILYRLWQK